MKRAGDARALERLRRGVFRPRRHQARHFGLGDGDFLPPVSGKADIGDGVVDGFGHWREIPVGFGAGLAARPVLRNKHISKSLYHIPGPV